MKGSSLDARQLTYFLGVVDHGGFSRAAESLHLSQPSLSQTIKQLERDLGVELFHRVGRGVELTGPGRQLVGPARQVVRDLQAVRDAMMSTRGLERGTIDISSMPSPGIEPLTTLVRRLSDRHPGLSTKVDGAFTPLEVIHAVASGASEIGLLGAAGRPQAGDLHVIELDLQPLILISPPGTPGEAIIERSELVGLRFVISQRGSLMRQLVDDVLAAGAGVRVVTEVAHRTSLLPLVLAGIGHSVMPESWRDIAERAGCVVRRIDPPAHLHVALVHRRAALTPAGRAFVDIAQELADEIRSPS